MFIWNNNVMSIFGPNLYGGSILVATGLDTSNGVYTFTSALGTVQKMFMTNGVKAYTYDPAGGLVQVTNANYPATTTKGAVYIDGGTYVMDANSNIWGSALNDATSWSALNVIKAQVNPELGIGIAKQMVYLIAFKEYSTEVFFDAGNAVGSPLGPVWGSLQSVGCRHQDTIRDLEGVLFWVSNSRAGGLGVCMLSQLGIKVISTAPIERLLQNADFTTVYSWAARCNGHMFYVLTLVNSNLTLCYDTTSEHWAQWMDGSGDYLNISAAATDPLGRVLIQSGTDGDIYVLDIAYGADEGVPFSFEVVTPNFDGGARTVKYLHHLDIEADQVPGATLQVQVSDDDYQTWSNFRSLDLGGKRPRLTQCGSFRRRAFHFKYYGTKPLRITAVNLMVTPGEI
jgi:hypothetical protein